ncbi:hypothetical protein HYV74_04855 [Candidatus Uhrbacteria bacterium]|nr:hypothetical protein [Candidatus Uhrbacteria bacterium]
MAGSIALIVTFGWFVWPTAAFAEEDPRADLRTRIEHRYDLLFKLDTLLRTFEDDVQEATERQREEATIHPGLDAPERTHTPENIFAPTNGRSRIRNLLLMTFLLSS